MTNFRGMSQGLFWKIFPKKSFYYLMTSPWTIIGMSHVASIGGGLVHLGMISTLTSYVTYFNYLSSKLITSKNPGGDSGGFLENFSKGHFKEFGSWLRRVLGKFFQNTWFEIKIEIYDFRVVTQKGFWKIFPDKIFVLFLNFFRFY